MIVNHKDFRMVNDKQGYGVGFQLLNQASFDPDEVDFALTLLNSRRTTAGDGLVAIDCGANIGVHTIEWAKHMSNWGDVIAVEAQERLFYALAGNIALNNCFNARAIYAAVGAQAGSLLVPCPDYNVAASFGSLELRQHDNTEFIGQLIDYSPSKCTEVPMLTIDQLVTNRVDLIKIDVEGMELDVLEGAQASLLRYKPIMLIEVIKTNRQLLQDRLISLGYKLFPMGINVLAVHESDSLKVQTISMK